MYKKNYRVGARVDGDSGIMTFSDLRISADQAILFAD